MSETTTALPRPSWTVRRRIIIASLLFCAVLVTYVTVWGDDRSVLEVVVLSAFGLSIAVIGSYVFGAVWDDRNVMKEFGPAAYVRTPVPESGQTTTTVVAQTIDGPQE